jgi:hypothetical protein
MGEHTVVFSTAELAVCTGLVGLAIAVMQGDEAQAQEFGRNLSTPMVEEVAKGLVQRLNTAMQAAS